MSNEEVLADSRVVVGLSFGNSYSSIAHINSDGKTVVIANEEGDRQIPSILSYVDGEELQGAQAKAQLVRNSKNTVAFFRDFLGQDFKSIDPTPCHQSAHPIEKDSTVAFSIWDTDSKDPSTVTVQNITTRHLKRLIASATDFLGETVTAAVITVPTNFGPAQKEALSKAAQDAGIEVLQFISEPVAAILSYDAKEETPSPADKIIVVADFGGSRSDIAIVACRGGIYTVLATAHDWEVSGSKLDEKLMDFFAKEFLKKNKSAEDPRNNQRSAAKLRLTSEQVKIQLSNSATGSFSVESLSGGIDFTQSINRTRYELLSGQIFSAMTRLILSTVEKAELDPLDITHILLSGGTSHTPKLTSNAKLTFQHAEILSNQSPTGINPSELAARGAAIQASLIADFELENIRESCEPVVTVTPHLAQALGVMAISGDSTHGKFQVMVEANTPTPVRKTITFATPREGGDVLIKVCEGTRHIKVSKPEPKSNGTKKATVESDDSDDSDDDDSDEDEETREKVWQVGKVVAEAAVKGVKKGGRVEVQIDVRPDLAVSVIAREVHGKSGVRGAVDAPKGVENGSS